MFKFFGFLLVVLSCWGCRDVPRNVQWVLEASEGNRAELESVLEHYRASGDREKLMAAEFLIGNMRNKYYFEDELIDRYDVLFSLYDSLQNIGIAGDGEVILQTWDSLEHHYGSLHATRFEPRHDARHITSGYLIKSIDDAFIAWRTAPWHDSVDFDLFLNYVLPYRASQEPLELYREKYMNRYALLRDTMSNPSDLLRFARAVNYDIYYRHGFRASGKLWDYPLSIPPSNMELGHRGACRHHVDYAAWVLRSNGLPVAIDRAVWGNRSSGHTWNVIMLPEGRIFPFESLDPWMKYQSLAYKPAKVFRNTFRNIIPDVDDRMPTDIPPEIFREDELDVTDQYARVFDVEVPVSFPFEGEEAKGYGVLCVFDNSNWRPVDYGPSRKGTLQFRKVPEGLMYLGMYYHRGSLTPATHPFRLDSLGRTHFVVADSVHTQSLVLRRKYPLFDAMRTHMQQLRWSTVEGASNAAFSDAQDLFVLDFVAEEYVDTAVWSDRPFRYVRLRFAPDHKGNLAELEFYGRIRPDAPEQRLTGTPIGFPKSTLEGKIPYLKALDDDPATFFDVSRESDGWVGLDLGRPMYISRVRLCPRSDTNFILPGDVYELRYWHQGAWVTHGTHLADGTPLIINRVPSHGLYWLRNTTKGREERIFTYEDGKQIFW